jgi:hypothetical protein
MRLAVPEERKAPVAITIDAEQRDALYRLLDRFGGIEETAMALDRGDHPDAFRLLRRSATGLRLIEDLGFGWEERDTRTVFELTMSAEALRPLLTRLQQMCIEAVETYMARPRETRRRRSATWPGRWPAVRC